MINELVNYLDTVLTDCHYPVTFCGDKSNVLNRWIIKCEQVTDNDSNSMTPGICTRGRILLNTDLAFAKPEELENNWFYHVEDNRTSLGFQQPFYEYNHFEKYFSTEKDKRVYALCDVFCSVSRQIHFFISAVSPIRVWINGQLVYHSSFVYHSRPYRFIYRFRQGDNSILVEQTSLIKDYTRNLMPAEFSLKIQPVDYLRADGAVHYFSEQLIDDLKYTYTICPDKVFYRPQETIKLVVLPRCFAGTEQVTVTAADVNGSVIKNFNTTIPGQMILDIDPLYEGILDITVAAQADRYKNSRILVYRGDFGRKRDALIRKAGEETGCNGSLIDNFTKICQIPDDNGITVRGSQELILADFHKLILEKCAAFEKYITSGDADSSHTFLTVYKQDALLFYNSDIDDGFCAYRLHVPLHYAADKKYPLVIFLFFGFGNSRYPDFIMERYKEKGALDDAIAVSMPARGAFNRDYINEMNYFRVLDEIGRSLSIDKDRIYIIGSCTGGTEGIGLALKAPHLFAGITCTWTTPRLNVYNPDYDYLKNLDNVTTYHLLNIEDNIFNFPRLLHTLKYLCRAKTWYFDNLSHIEADFLTDYRKVFGEMLKEPAEKYPAEIQYTVSEPIYNRSYWLIIDYINNLRQPGLIRARIVSPRLIEITTDNIGRLHLLINREAMKLGQDIQLTVNAHKQMFHLDNYALITIEPAENTLAGKYRAISAADFHEKYSRVLNAENRLGIKAVHSKKCLIIKSEPLSRDSRDLMKRLIMLLKQPLKERIRSYKYNFRAESDFIAGHSDQANFIYPIDARDLNDFQRSLLVQATAKIEADSITYRGHTYSGAYFALIKCQNPFAARHCALFIIYNNEQAAQELLKFWALFDTDNLFYSDTIIYHDGNYLDFRGEENLSNTDDIC